MAETLKIVTTQRRQAKGSITRALTFAENLPENCTNGDIEARIKRLETVWQEYQQLTRDLYSYEGEEGYVDPEGEFSTYEEKYLQASSIFEEWKRLHPLGDGDHSDAFSRLAEQQTTLLQRISNSPVPAPMRDLDLPKINIQPFTGVYKDWPAFRDLFVSTIDSRVNLTNTQKFHYLKSFLRDEAANLVKHIQITDAAYATAWERLKERFERPRYIVTSFIESFMSLPSIPQENAIGLRKISDGASEVIRGLEAVEQNERDHWLIHILQTKLDPESRKKWIENSRATIKPTVHEFLAFLDLRCEELELVQRKSSSSSSKSSTVNKLHASQTLVAVNNDQQKCYKCNSAEHTLTKCPRFLSTSVDDRRSLVKNKSLCFNCLKSGHNAYKCKSSFRCKSCNRRHHTLVHPQSSEATGENKSELSGPESVALNSVAKIIDQTSTGNCPVRYVPQSLLPTAVAEVRNAEGEFVKCRILIDSASELSYATEACVQRLSLPRTSSRISICGISSVKADITRGCSILSLKSRVSQHTFAVKVHILKQITTYLPRDSIRAVDSKLTNNLILADPTFYCSSPIDILLGADYVWDVLTMEKIHDSQGNTMAISSIFGWIITSVKSVNQQRSAASHVAVVDIDRSLRSFWEVEESCHDKIHDTGSVFAEEVFRETHSRHTDGRYLVHLPFKEKDVTFADTFEGALVRFNAVERRLQKNCSLKAQYIEFMREYIELGHMRKLRDDEIEVPNHKLFYMPHHPVVTTKLRVVFDGSFVDVNGVSLNSKLHVGPSIQRNLFSVCLRFRFHRFIFSADIVKMFRQIWVAEQHRNFQRILWMEDPSDQLNHYQLCTVTYGTASAPFLAVRVLEQLAEDYKSTHPVASKVLLEDFYVDDVLTGADSEVELVAIRDQLVQLLSLAGLELRKWVSNSRYLVKEYGDICGPSFLTQSDDGSAKVLGIYWHADNDIIKYKVNLNSCTNATKRHVLSEVAKIFDPLGLVAPVIVQFKILFQELWLHNLQWDDVLPENLAKLWFKYRQDLLNLSNLEVNRYAHNSKNVLELHGFSDASTKAYAAVIYCRCKEKGGSIQTSLIAAKTRVAPIKQISLPRLELCGAVLLTRLMKTVMESFPDKQFSLHAWCDSTVVLSWLTIQPIKLKVFVANRTSEILSTLPRSCWKHVSSKDNPADCASRGITADHLIKHDLWWQGPTWLRDGKAHVSGFNQMTNVKQAEVEAELKAVSLVTNQIDQYNAYEELVKNTSSWWRLVRITSYTLRFINACKGKNIFYNHLTFKEIREARILLLKIAQNQFCSEKKHLKSGTGLDSRSKLLKLAPFIGEDGLIRVGGRIGNAALTMETQHPIILPKEHRITQLILNYEHIQNLHPGVSALFVIVRQKYWIIGARNLIRKLTHDCLKCFRQAQHTTSQMMADLPSVRVNQAFPFQNCGCDYAGPLALKTSRLRNARISKGYICVFVCMVTSAIHIELATAMTTECFIAALRRFMARRGKCSHIFSDNGRNFVGASKALNDMYRLLQSQTHNETISALLSKEGIKWTYIPPYSPHWGGIWESAVRSVKLHLRRVIGDTVLTFEQMHTLLAQIEAVVNSRPLGVAPDSDNMYLSPSHFLIGRPYTMVAEGDISEVPVNRLKYWQHIQSMYQGFWKRWHMEYLTSLQSRRKWHLKQPNIEIGDLVLVKEANLPPSMWVLGKVTKTFPGPGGLTRVVNLRTALGEITRPITKLAVLPVLRN